MAIVRQYEAGATLRALAVKYDVAIGTIRRLLRAWEVPVRTNSEACALRRRLLGAPARRPLPANPKRVFGVLYHLGMTVDDIASCYEATPDKVRDLLQEEGTTMRRAGRLSRDATPEMINAYNGGLTIREVATQAGHYPETMRRMPLRAGVQLRPRGGYFARKTPEG